MTHNLRALPHEGHLSVSQANACEQASKLAFNLMDPRFSKNSEHGTAMPPGNSPLLTSLIVVPFVLIGEVFFFRTTRIATLKAQVVGMFAVKEKNEALFIGSLVVAPEYGRHGMAQYILNCVGKLAAKLDKKWMGL